MGGRLDLGTQKLTDGPVNPDPLGDYYIERGPRYIQIRPDRSGRKGGGGKRGQIRTFSRRSWLALGRRLGSIDIEQLEKQRIAAGRRFFALTLTQGADGYVSRNTFRAWKERVRREGAEVLLWKREYQRRGAPHWHVLISWSKVHTHPVQLIGHWIELTEWTGAQYIGQHHREVDGVEGLMRYMLKDAAKHASHYQHNAPEDAEPGRWWWISPLIPTTTSLMWLTGIRASEALASVWDSVPGRILESVWFSRAWLGQAAVTIFL